MEKFLRDLSGEVHNRLKEINKYGNRITFKVFLYFQGVFGRNKYCTQLSVTCSKSTIKKKEKKKKIKNTKNDVMVLLLFVNF